MDHCIYISLSPYFPIYGACDNQGDGDTTATEIESDLLVWTAGSRPSPLVSRLGLAKDGRGRVEVNRRLQPRRRAGQAAGGGDEDASATGEGEAWADGVYCVGDMASVRGMDLNPSAQVRPVPVSPAERVARGPFSTASAVFPSPGGR